jgi:hypothetical protein
MGRIALRRSLTVLIVAGSAGLAVAHAVLTKATLDADAVDANAATTVVLSFNSRIEPAFTQIHLVDHARTERPVASRPRERPSEVEVELPALPAGPYGLKYRVLAADGHVTESLLRFRVRPAD